MIGPDNALWKQCWRDQATDFHLPATNPLLTRFWPELRPTTPCRVLVPLCGKSLDLLWLANQGCEVVGVELSPVAISAFFQERGLQPSRRQVGRLTLWHHGAIGILCGDFFRLTAADLGPITAIYDRAALTALPESHRPAYVAHLRHIAPDAGQMLLLTAEEPDADETPAQTLTPAEEITSLYASAWHIELRHVVASQAVSDDPTAAQRIDHKVYILTARSQPLLPAPP